MAFIPPLLAALGSTVVGTTAAATMSSAALTTVGLMAAGTAVSTVGAIAGAKAQSNQLKSQAYADEYNAQVLKGNAEVANAEANQREELLRRQFGQVQGEAIAGVAQSGTAMEGSNLDLLRQNAVNAEMDALTIRYEGQQKARGLMAQSVLERYQARAGRAAARDTMSAGFLNAGASLLSGGAKAYGISHGISLGG